MHAMPCFALPCLAFAYSLHITLHSCLWQGEMDPDPDSDKNKQLVTKERNIFHSHSFSGNLFFRSISFLFVRPTANIDRKRRGKGTDRGDRGYG